MSLAFRLGFSVITRRIISNLGDDFKRFPHPVKVSMIIFQRRLRLRVAQEKHHIGKARAVAESRRREDRRRRVPQPVEKEVAYA